MKYSEFEALCQREWRPGDKGYGNVTGLHLTEASYNELVMGATLFHGEFQNPVTRFPVAITCVTDVDTVTVDYGPQGTVTRLVAAGQPPARVSTDVAGFTAEVEAGHAAILKMLTELQARLAAAERVCVLYGRQSGLSGDEAKALHELWSQWLDIAGLDVLSPEAHPELNEERITELARKRDVVRGQTLEWARKVQNVPLDGYPG